jgi:hypothetical protein
VSDVLGGKKRWRRCRGGRGKGRCSENKDSGGVGLRVKHEHELCEKSLKNAHQLELDNVSLRVKHELDIGKDGPQMVSGKRDKDRLFELREVECEMTGCYQGYRCVWPPPWACLDGALLKHLEMVQRGTRTRSVLPVFDMDVLDEDYARPPQHLVTRSPPSAQAILDQHNNHRSNHSAPA